MFGGKVPREPDQNIITGENDIGLASAAIWSYLIDLERMIDKFPDPLWYEMWEMKLADATDQFNLKSKYIKIDGLSKGLVEDAFRNDIADDLGLI